MGWVLITTATLPGQPAGAMQVDCPYGEVVVVNDEQLCFPNVSGPLPPEGGPIEFGAPSGGTGVQVWCIRHDQREASSATNPWRVSCNAGNWWFSVDWDCYIRGRDDVTRDPDWPRWDVGEDEEGRVFEIRCYPPQENQDGLMFMNGGGLWQASQMIIGPESPPGLGGTPSVIPGLWVDAVNALAMRGPEIRTAPPLAGAALVNLPVWLWTEPGGRVWPQGEPLHEFAAAAGERVDAYAEPLRIEWDMGDGRGPVTCGGPGEAWEQGRSLLAPGECHHIYRQPSRHQPGGQFEITAITTWRVWWEINGTFDGELELEVGSTASYQVNEIQVLTGAGR
jgi:hypothetical protein